MSANLCKCQSLLSQKNYEAVNVLLSQLQEATLEKCVREEKQEGSDSDSEEEEDCQMVCIIFNGENNWLQIVCSSNKNYNMDTSYEM